MIKNYKLFTTPTCPSCPKVKEKMKTVDMEGEFIDASSPEGGAQAGKYGITSVPTVLFFDESGEVVHMAQSVRQVEKVLSE